MNYTKRSMAQDPAAFFITTGVSNGFDPPDVIAACDIFRINGGLLHNFHEQEVVEFWGSVARMRADKAWNQETKKKVSDLLLDKRYSLTIRKLFTKHPEANYVDQTAREGRRIIIRDLLNKKNTDPSIRKTPPRVVFSSIDTDDEDEDGHSHSHSPILLHDVSSPREEFRCGDVFTEASALNKMIEVTQASKIWIKWQCYVESNGIVVIPPQLDLLRSFTLHHADSCQVHLKSGEWEKRYYVNMTTCNFSEKLLPHHEGFLPMT
ncbi:MAG: hypothetical protein ACMG6E_03390, partial [Candidatus Roizmanbacteria bacterium]